MTVLEAIKLSTDFLERKSIPSARLSAEILLADLLRLKRLDLYLKYDRPLSKLEIDSYRELILRRSNGEPVQYIVGHTNFYGLEFLVTPSVLIPRNDTEELVELVIMYLNSFSHQVNVLDIGTGSGNISVSIAHGCNHAEVTSIDISQEAILIAKKNAELNNVTSRINFICNDVENYDFENKLFDVIVSNPPYISLDEFSKLNAEVSKYEPRLALTDEGDGLKYFKIIASKSAQLLKNGGSIFFEVGYNQATDVKNILLDNGFIDVSIIKDYSEINRFIHGIFK